MGVLDFTPEELSLLREMTALAKRGALFPRKPIPTEPSFAAPGNYVAKVSSAPGGFLPPLDVSGTRFTGTGTGTGTESEYLDDIPGMATCEIWRINSQGRLETMGFSRKIYNFSEVTFTDDWIPVMKAKNGKYLALWCGI